MKTTWDVDGATVVELRVRQFGKHDLTINGSRQKVALSGWKKSEASFDLANGSRGTISSSPQYWTYPEVRLRVDGRLVAERQKGVLKCKACGKIVQPNDQFCQSCGQAQPTAEMRYNKKAADAAVGAIGALAILFSIAGIALFFIARSKSDPLLAQLSGLQPDQILKPHGVAVTVAQLRKQLIWAPWSALVVNLVLAVVMGMLLLWGKRSPLPAVLVAAATYAVVVVMTAILDPASLAQGWIIKFMIIALLFRGIKGALALRTASV